MGIDFTSSKQATPSTENAKEMQGAVSIFRDGGKLHRSEKVGQWLVEPFLVGDAARD